MPQSMPSKGERTREMILARTAPLFNTVGWGKLSLSEIMAATGLEKGGIYNHFKNREELMVAAFDHAVGIMRARFERALNGRGHAVDQLRAVLAVWAESPLDTPVGGGCPILNAAIEADDADPQLRARARQAMDELLRLLRLILLRGKRRGEVRPQVDEIALASLAISTLEGALMLSRLYGSNTYMQTAIAHLEAHLEAAVRAPA